MSIIDDFKDINRRMNRKPAIAATYGIPAETTELKPELFTSEEGGMWRSLAEFIPYSQQNRQYAAQLMQQRPND